MREADVYSAGRSRASVWRQVPFRRRASDGKSLNRTVKRQTLSPNNVARVNFTIRVLRRFFADVSGRTSTLPSRNRRGLCRKTATCQERTLAILADFRHCHTVVSHYGIVYLGLCDPTPAMGQQGATTAMVPCPVLRRGLQQLLPVSYGDCETEIFARRPCPYCRNYLFYCVASINQRLLGCRVNVDVIKGLNHISTRLL
jgi:hypothetical protein